MPAYQYLIVLARNAEPLTKMAVLSTDEGVLLVAVAYLVTGLKLRLQQMRYGLRIWCDLLAKQTQQAKAM